MESVHNNDNRNLADEAFHTRAFETAAERNAASRLPPERRQWMIDNLIVKYKVFEQGFEMILANHMPVVGGSHAKGIVGAILGSSRTGKSAICRYYKALYPATYDDEGEIFPVLHMTATVRMTPTEFADELYKLTASRYSPKGGGMAAYVNNALHRLLRVRTQLLIIDDAQYLFHGRADNGIPMFKLIKAILDFKELSIMLVGEERIDEYVHAIDAFDNRGYNSKTLLSLGSNGSDMKRFQGLLGSIDKRLPFANRSGLDTPSIGEHMYRYSQGKVGRVMKILQPAAYLAINDGSSHILPEHLMRSVATRVRTGDDFDYFGYLRHVA